MSSRDDAVPDERALIERAQAGDPVAQDDLFRRHIAGLHAWVRLKQHAKVAARESAMDVVQSVLRQVLKDLGQFEYCGDNSFRNWLLARASNELRNRERFHHAQRRDAGREALVPLSQFYASIATPSQILSARESVEQFERAFRSLAARDQEIILLVRVEGASHAEVAGRLGISVDASKKALSRAIVRLAACLESDD